MSAPATKATTATRAAMCPRALYEEGLRAVHGGRPAGVLVREAGGGCRPLPVSSWYAGRRPGDAGLLARCRDATIDVGCGPGRLVAALAARGMTALGIDVSAVAVGLTRSRGASVLRRSVFAPLPGEGRWRSVLLADGNIGIGADPVALLRRCRALLSHRGQVLVELEQPGGTRRVRVRLESGDRHSAWFDWVHLGVDEVAAVAAAVGLTVRVLWCDTRRWFAVLEKP
jgi:SAM-dependent methyltransferase